MNFKRGEDLGKTNVSEPNDPNSTQNVTCDLLIGAKTSVNYPGVVTEVTFFSPSSKGVHISPKVFQRIQT